MAERLITIGKFRLHRIYLPAEANVTVKAFYDGPTAGPTNSEQEDAITVQNYIKIAA